MKAKPPAAGVLSRHSTTGGRHALMLWPPAIRWTNLSSRSLSVHGLCSLPQGLPGRTVHPVVKSPRSKDAPRGRSRQWSAISTHTAESNMSWCAFFGWAPLPVSRNHLASSSQPSAVTSSVAVYCGKAASFVATRRLT
jgi:hypothetical protein